MASVCMICMEVQDNTSHLFLQRKLVVDVWNWNGDLFDIFFIVHLFFPYFHSCRDSWSLQIWNIVTSTIMNSFHSIWMTCNINRYNKVQELLHTTKMQIHTSIVTSAKISKDQSVGAYEDLLILQKYEADTILFVFYEDINGSLDVLCYFLG